MNKKALTLAELLIVMVIMFVLAAILFPALGRVREQGRRIQCANNLRQHGVAWNLYLADHDDFFPKYNTTAGTASEDVCRSDNFGGWIGDINKDPAGNRPLNRYLDIDSDTSPNVELFHCPNDIKPNYRTLIRGLNTFDVYGTSYSFNHLILTYGTAPSYIKRPFSTITNPHNKVQLEMCFHVNEPGHGGGGWTGPGSTAKVMVLFVDGHVEGPFIYPDEFDSGGGDKVLENPE